MIDPGGRLAATCPKCGTTGVLIWVESIPFGESTDGVFVLSISSCASGGIYAVEATCPSCGEEIDIA